MGFEKRAAWGRTKVAGRYTRGTHMLEVDFKSGQGDVVATIDGHRIRVETKGGILNTTHPGQTSKLRRGLCEAVGMLMNGTRTQGTARLPAAVPCHRVTARLARSMADRCQAAGIEIALVSASGALQMITGVGEGAGSWDWLLPPGAAWCLICIRGLPEMVGPEDLKSAIQKVRRYLLHP